MLIAYHLLPTEILTVLSHRGVVRSSEYVAPPRSGLQRIKGRTESELSFNPIMPSLSEEYINSRTALIRYLPVGVDSVEAAATWRTGFIEKYVSYLVGPILIETDLFLLGSFSYRCVS